MSERVLKTLTCRGLRVGPSKLVSVGSVFFTYGVSKKDASISVP